jgi:3,4-dihydroxy 2-butanone 4-phosphate synthase/GTP cyclohydrolase II
LLDRLGLPMMTRDNRSRLGTAFTLSIEAAEGVTTGISAADRATTVQAAIADEAKPQDIVSPGHVFPLRARAGGVLVRAGHSEASVDLAEMAGCKKAAVICEIMKPDGTMARLDDLVGYCQEHGLLLASIADLIAYRERRESLIELTGEGDLELPEGCCRAYSYRATISGEQHLALVFGDAAAPGRDIEEPVLVRVQQEWLLADAFASATGPQRLGLDAALAQLAAAGRGVLLYMRDGRAERLPAELAAHGGQRHGEMPVLPPMDERSYGIGAQILRDLGIRRMRLVTGSGRSPSALSGHGLEVVEMVAPDAG